MTTLREEIQAEIEAVKAKAATDVANLEAHLATAGTWLQMEVASIKEHIAALIAHFKRNPPAVPPVVPPAA